MEQKRLSETAENVIAFVIAAIVIAGIILGFGWTSVKAWIDGPLVWRDSKDFSISFSGVEAIPRDDSNFKVNFNVNNTSGVVIDDYEILVEFGNSTIKLDSLYSADIENGYGTIGTTIRKSDPYGYRNSITEDDYYMLKSNRVYDSDMTYKIRYLKSYYEKKTVLNNKGWKKNLLLIAASFVFGLIGFESNIGSSVLRIIFKILGMPGIVLLVAVMLVAGGAAGSGASSQSSRESVDNSVRQRAKEQYKRAAQHKAGFEMHGNTREAARQQRFMDEARADMIAGSKNSVAKESYKRYAAWEAGARMSGNEREAAKAQGMKDQAFADILTERMKDD